MPILDMFVSRECQYLVVDLLAAAAVFLARTRLRSLKPREEGLRFAISDDA
jgi:hypothetical protein